MIFFMACRALPCAGGGIVLWLQWTLYTLAGLSEYAEESIMPKPGKSALFRIAGLYGQSLPAMRLVEFAGFREDFGESIGELVEATFRRAVRQRTAEHLDGMLSEQQRIDDTVQAAAR